MNEAEKPKRNWRDVKRSTSRLELKLPPEVYLQIKTTSQARGLTASQFIFYLLQQEAIPTSVASEVTLADVSRLAFAVSQLPSELKRLHGELQRQGGLAKHLYLKGADANATADALFAIRDTSHKIEQALKVALEEYAQFRIDLERVARRLAGRS